MKWFQKIKNEMIANDKNGMTLKDKKRNMILKGKPEVEMKTENNFER